MSYRSRLTIDAARYRWLREHLEYVEFDGLTTDTCDVGLDYAIDRRVALGDGYGKAIHHINGNIYDHCVENLRVVDAGTCVRPK